MNNWEKKVQDEQTDLRKSVEFALSGETNDINKGVASDLMYSDSELNKVQKKGSDIKPKIDSLIVSEIETMVELKSKTAALLKEIGENPKSSRNNGKYQFSVYDYDLIYPQENNPGGLNEITEKGKLMREYNNLMYSLSRCTEETSYLKTMKEAIKESKTYTLPIRVANKLGF